MFIFSYLIGIKFFLNFCFTYIHVLVFNFHVLCLDFDLGFFLFRIGLILGFNNLFTLNFFHLLCVILVFL
jgi:hypothetical protein